MKILLFVFLFSSSALAVFEEHGVGNGGDGMAIEFVNRGREIALKLDGMNEACRGALRFSPSDLPGLLDKTVVQSSSEELILRGRPVEAINYPRESRILFHRGSWERKDSYIRDQLVLHELLGLLEAGDENYALTMQAFLLLNDAICSPGNGKVADAGDPQEVFFLGSKVFLEGKVNLPGNDYSTSWELVQQPGGSKAKAEAVGRSGLDLLLDMEGEYRLKFSVRSPRWGEFSDITWVRVRRPNPRDCDKEESIPGPGFASLDIGEAGGLKPMCRGWVYLGNRTESRIDLLNVVTGKLGASYPLPAKPRQIALDGEKNILYVTTDSSNLVKLDLETGETKLFPTEYRSPQIGLLSSHWLVVGGELDYRYHIDLIDTATGKTKNRTQYFGSNSFAINQKKQKLYVNGGINIEQYSFLPKKLSFRKEGEVQELGRNARNMAVSADGKRLAVPAPGTGGFSGYGVIDVVAEDVRAYSGQWATESFVWASAFSPDGKLLATIDYNGLVLFSTEGYRQLTRFPIKSVSVRYTPQIEFSPGGRFLYALEEGFGQVRLHWARVP